MKITTSRFGVVEVDDKRVMTFPKGLLGFPGRHRYVLIETGQDSYFWWLQSASEPDLAFVVTDPVLFFEDYTIEMNPEHFKLLDLKTADDAQIFVIVNKHDDRFTVNLQGPLMINVRNCIGEQLVLSDRRYTTRVPLVEVVGD